MFKPLKQFIPLMLGFYLLSFSVIAQVSVVDDKNNTVVLLKPASRIISLAPHVTESLFAAGAGSKIIGAVKYSDYPEAAKKIPRVGGYPSVDMEKIIALKPDLVIAWPEGNNPKQLEKLKALGLKLFMSDPTQPIEIANTIKRFGVLAGTGDIANQSAQKFIEHYQRLKNNYSGKKKIRVFYQIWNRPIMTISQQHLISEIINLCGGVNIFADLNSSTPRITLESVLSANPEAIVSGGMGSVKPEWLDEWRKWKHLSAVKNNHLYYIDPSLMQRVGPRILNGADKLCQFVELARK